MLLHDRTFSRAPGDACAAPCHAEPRVLTRRATSKLCSGLRLCRQMQVVQDTSGNRAPAASVLHNHRKYLAIRRRRGGLGYETILMKVQTARRQEETWHWSKVWSLWSRSSKRLCSKSSVNAARGHMEIGKESTVTTLWRPYVMHQCRNAIKMSIEPCHT